jgi:hypothetical protein
MIQMKMIYDTDEDDIDNMILILKALKRQLTR